MFQRKGEKYADRILAFHFLFKTSCNFIIYMLFSLCNFKNNKYKIPVCIEH